MSERGYLSIGEVLDLLKAEFPDITISKIRFLESQGLLEPERTASGYRKFYDPDVDRLRFILQQQKEKYLPLKVIRGRLGGEPPDSAGEFVRAASAVVVDSNDPVDDDGRGDDAGGSDAHDAATMADAQGRHPTAFPRVPTRSVAPRPAPHSTEARQRIAPGRSDTDNARNRSLPVGREQSPGPATDETAHASHPAMSHDPATRPAEPVAQPDAALVSSARSAPLLAGGGSGVSMNLDELASAAGLTVELVRQLEQYGLIVGHGVFSQMYYDEEALLVARVAAGFLQFGVEPRHLRIYKTSAEREAGLFEQVVTPQLKRRNPEARTTALANLMELARLGEQLRAVTVRQVLRAAIDAK